jgi:hypothetical protein
MMGEDILGRSWKEGRKGRKAGRLESFRGGLTSIGIAAPHQPALKKSGYSIFSD